MIKPFPLVLLILFSFYCISCTKEKDEISTEQTILDDQATNVTLTLDSEVDETESESSASPEGSRQASTRIESPGRNESFLSLPSRKIFPSDFKIGYLGDKYSASSDKRKILQIVEEFIASLSQSVINQDSIHPDWIILLTRSLQYNIDKGYIPKKIRAGTIFFDEQTARLNIRLFSGKGITEGEIFLEFYEENWLITDFQASLIKLSEIYRKSDELYVPSEYTELNRYFNNF